MSYGTPRRRDRSRKYDQCRHDLPLENPTYKKDVLTHVLSQRSEIVTLFFDLPIVIPWPELLKRDLALVAQIVQILDDLRNIGDTLAQLAKFPRPLLLSVLIAIPIDQQPVTNVDMGQI